MAKINKFKICIDVMTVLLLSAGTVIGGYACFQYIKSNMVNSGAALVNLDRQMYQKTSAQPHLQALFAKFPTSIDARKASQQALLLFLSDNETISFTWKDIPDLYYQIFQYDNFNRSDRKKFRDAYFFAEDILYLLSNCYIANKYKLMPNDDLKAWSAYIDEIGMHPFFLAAVYCGHKYGYIDSNFATYIVNCLTQSKQSKTRISMLHTIYPDILAEDWPERAGNNVSKKN